MTAFQEGHLPDPLTISRADRDKIIASNDACITILRAMISQPDELRAMSAVALALALDGVNMLLEDL